MTASFASGALQELHLPTTGVTARCTLALADALRSGSGLKVLNMYGNSLGDEGAANLASLFADGGALSGLTTLGIGVNSIGAAGAAALGKAIGSCPTCKLSTLGLYRNDVGDEGAMALAESVVAPNIDLQNLFLGGNGISDTGAVALASALMSNNNLIALSLEGGGIGGVGVGAGTMELVLGSTVLLA